MRLINYNASKLLKQARISKRYSQRDLHYKIAPTSCKVPMQISNMELNKAPIPPKLIPKLCKVLGIPKEVFIEQMVQDYRISLINEVEKHEYRNESSENH